MVFIGLAVLAPHAAAAQSIAAPALPDARAIHSCLSQTRSAECLDQLFGEALQHHTTAELLELIRRLEQDDPQLKSACHPVVHAIGRETYRLKGNIHDSFSACDQTCHSGCYHGTVERFLRGDGLYTQVDKHPSAAELKSKAAGACDPNANLRLRFQCLHGLGHALTFFSRYRLPAALEACDGLPDEWSRRSCYGGVFMENVFSATPAARDLSARDYHYPCNQVAPKYRAECYTMQTSRMAEMGLAADEIFNQCDRAGDFRLECALSVGRDLSNEARLGESRAAAATCGRAAGESRVACFRGLVYALIDHTWDGRYALPFCAALPQENEQIGCMRLGTEYLSATFGKSPAEIAGECAKYWPSPARCAGLVAR